MKRANLLVPVLALAAASHAEIKFAEIDPGHFHAALVLNRSYEGVSRNVAVFAPKGPDVASHVKLVEAFNTRAKNPTDWRESVYTGDDYLARAMAADDPKNTVVVLAGRNDRKADYYLAAVKAGFNVLSDKPMAITPAAFEKFKEAAALAEKKNLRFADIMTERNEITTILQRQLVMNRELYGEQEKGTPEDPAVTKVSVHHFCKLVNGKPLTRPGWYYDTDQQGEAIVDVTTHLVDLVQWETFPGETLACSDVKMLSARTWPTPISAADYKTSTGLDTWPDFLKKDLDANGTLQCMANGEFTYALRGVHVKVGVEWHFMPPAGTGDTHYSLMRGTRAEITIRQDATTGYKPTLFVKARGDAAATGASLEKALRRIALTWRGVAAVPCGAGEWKITYPAKYDIGHEAHFSQVMTAYLDWMKAGEQPADYLPNMIVKYHTLVEAWKASRPAPKKIGIIGCDTSHTIAFTKMLNVAPDAVCAGWKVVVAHKWGSPDIFSSTNRYPKYIAQLREMGVEMADTIDGLLAKCDYVMLETCDGRPHLAQAEKVFRSGKPVFIDKPVTASLEDAKRLVALGKRLNAKWFCSSSLRYVKNAQAARNGTLGKVRGAETWTPESFEPTQSPFYWYAIHGAEPLFTIMGAGCETVSCLSGPDGDVVTGVWKDGRIGVMRAFLCGNGRRYSDYGGVIHLETGKVRSVLMGDYEGYYPLLVEILKFFKTGIVPVPNDETLEIYAFLEAAAQSREKNGAAVKIADLLK